MDVSKYGIIYGGNQKNLGPAGATFVIVKEDILGKVDREIPTMVDYRTHISKDSAFNTPPVLPIFSALQTLEWFKSIGGVAELEKRNLEKSALLYAEIERNKLFVGTVAEEDRSRMNVCFVVSSSCGEQRFSLSLYPISLPLEWIGWEHNPLAKIILVKLRPIYSYSLNIHLSQTL